METLYYDGRFGPVFARTEEAEQVQHALYTAKTWGEYRSMLPEGEWEERGASQRARRGPS